jgi:hypothetical protein
MQKAKSCTWGDHSEEHILSRSIGIYHVGEWSFFNFCEFGTICSDQPCCREKTTNFEDRIVTKAVLQSNFLSKALEYRLRSYFLQESWPRIIPLKPLVLSLVTVTNTNWYLTLHLYPNNFFFFFRRGEGCLLFACLFKVFVFLFFVFCLFCFFFGKEFLVKNGSKIPPSWR